MQPLNERDIRSALINVSVRERAQLSLPADLSQIDWGKIDYLGWRDPKLPAVGYLIAETGDGTRGIMLRAGAPTARSRPQCALCEDVTLPNDVVLFSARRAGRAGRKGDTVGSLICARFECSRNVRQLPPSMLAGDDPAYIRELRIEALRERVGRFVARVSAPS